LTVGRVQEDCSVGQREHIFSPGRLFRGFNFSFGPEIFVAQCGQLKPAGAGGRPPVKWSADPSRDGVLAEKIDRRVDGRRLGAEGFLELLNRDRLRGDRGSMTSAANDQRRK